MKRFLIVLLLWSSIVHLLESDSHGQDNFSRVARVFGRDIYMSDLNPTNEELEFIKRGTENMRRQMENSPRTTSGFPAPPPLPTVEEIISRGKSDKLARLIWEPILAEFDRAHPDVEPTKAEVEELTNFMNAAKKAQALSKEAEETETKLSASGKKDVAKMLDEMHRGFVKTWKRSKALYEEHGGVVIFQQANPLEPVGAMRALLEYHQAKGDFEIYDEQLKQRFWNYYLQDHGRWKVQSPDYSVPWWLQKPYPPASIRDPIPPPSIR